jgi:hypothetical protein
MLNLKIKFPIAALCLLAIFLTACPKPDPLKSAIKASYRLPAATNDIIAKVTIARDRGLITPEQARSFGTALNDLARSEVVFVGMVRAANDTFKRTGTLPDATRAGLRSFFDTSIIEPFLRVLELAKLLSGADVDLILVAVTAVRLLINTIAGGIGSARSLSQSGPMPYIYTERGFV